ncbi:MAG: histidine phosphotransferase [Sphingomonadaceae bacterium]|nr:histidine phosphotransferase [Sphingomonadaceae bacterium]
MRMRDDPFDFAGLLCARLCHDLLGPVGALGNGLELLALDQDPAMRRQTLELMTSSSAAVAAKLKFFRLAFGTGGDMAQRLPITGVQTVINDFYALRPNIRLGWVVNGVDLPHPMARLLAVFAMLAGDALLRGGDLDIAVDHTGPASEIVVRAAGERIAFDAEHRLAMEGGSVPYFDTRTVPAQLAARLADRFGMTLQISPPESAKLLLGATAQS